MYKYGPLRTTAVLQVTLVTFGAQSCRRLAMHTSNFQLVYALRLQHALPSQLIAWQLYIHVHTAMEIWRQHTVSRYIYLVLDNFSVACGHSSSPFQHSIWKHWRWSYIQKMGAPTHSNCHLTRVTGARMFRLITSFKSCFDNTALNTESTSMALLMYQMFPRDV